MKAGAAPWSSPLTTRVQIESTLPWFRLCGLLRAGDIMLSLLFSFNGRLRRLHWWLLRIGVLIIGIAILVGAVSAIRVAFPDVIVGDGMNLSLNPIAQTIWAVTFFAVLGLGFWSLLAIGVKRWHDREKSGFWIFLGLVPLIGPIWTIIECGFLDGTQGSNKYGASPKGIADDHAAVFT
jgi:uncharacterized membrane protein YhaH (DUF805 family)